MNSTISPSLKSRMPALVGLPRLEEHADWPAPAAIVASSCLGRLASIDPTGPMKDVEMLGLARRQTTGTSRMGWIGLHVSGTKTEDASICIGRGQSAGAGLQLCGPTSSADACRRRQPVTLSRTDGSIVKNR